MMEAWEREDWRNLTWQDARAESCLAGVRLVGRMKMLGFSLREDAILQTLAQDVVKISEIEG